MCAKATLFSTSTTQSELRKYHAKISREPTASPPQEATTCSSLTSPGRWVRITAWSSLRSPARRARVCRLVYDRELLMSSWIIVTSTDPHFCLFVLWILPQGSHITRWPGFYILQWKFHNMAACSATNLPRVDDVLATLQVSSHKCKVMYYTEVLGSEDFRLVCGWTMETFICVCDV